MGRQAAGVRCVGLVWAEVVRSAEAVGTRVVALSDESEFACRRSFHLGTAFERLAQDGVSV